MRLQRLSGETGNILLAKLEGDNPAGSVKDRPALSMIKHAEERGEIKPGDTLIEATSGNTGIALAMAAAVRGYRMVLIMPEHMSVERQAAMRAFGAEIVPVTKQEGMEGARDLAEKMERNGEGKVLDQFANPDNPRAHYEGTGPEIWRDTGGAITHFVSSMGTTGTIMGASRFFKEKNPEIQIVGVQPEGDENIPGIRRWPEAYLPKIYQKEKVDKFIDVTPAEAEDMKTGRRGRHLCRHLFRRRHLRGVATVQGSGKCRYRHHHLRPWRPLFIHRGVQVIYICHRGHRGAQREKPYNP